MAELRGYPFKIRPLSPYEGRGDLIVFPDLPGCLSDGETVDEAIINGRDALEGWLETRSELKLSIPHQPRAWS